MSATSWDVIVVGGGSGGGPVADRLSEEPGRSVLLLDAGPDFPDEASDPPAFLAGGNTIGGGLAGVGAATPELDWGYRSEPLPGGRRIHLRRGRMVGGSSMVNGCVCVRGKPSDYDAWEAAGAAGWGWEAIRPELEAVERELGVRRYATDGLPPFERAFAAGFEQLGHRREEDLNAPGAWDGVVGPWPQNRRNEIRQGSLVTYVRRARCRPNLTIRGGMLVDRLLLRGSTVTGVRAIDGAGRVHELQAGAVVLAAGTYGSPPILLRSGIGPAEELARAGIAQAHELPVGRNVMDHAQCLFPVELAPEHATLAGVWYAIAARGRSFWSFPLAVDELLGRGVISFGSTAEDRSGTVALTSSRPDAAPSIDHRYGGWIARGEFAEAWEAFHGLLETPAMRAAGVVAVDAGRPLEDVLQERLGTGFHPAGGCSIGMVVDERLAVIGVDGLWVADASVFPRHVTNNPNLTCFVVGERGARSVVEHGR